MSTRCSTGIQIRVHIIKSGFGLIRPVCPLLSLPTSFSWKVVGWVSGRKGTAGKGMWLQYIPVHLGWRWNHHEAQVVTGMQTQVGGAELLKQGWSLIICFDSIDSPAP